MTVIGLVGLPGSGKSEAAAVAEKRGLPVVVMGDVIREACRERGLDPAEHHGTVAQQLREEGGPAAIAERTLPRIRERLEGHDTVVVEGIRSDVEVERFRESFDDDFRLVAIHAPYELRAERLRGRERDDTDSESLRERDERERGFGMDDAIADADVTVENTDSLESFRSRIDTLLEEL